MSKAGKVVIVTGAAQGIGLACATRFAGDGARVVIADIQSDKGDAAARTLRKAGHDVIFFECDVGDGAQVTALVAAAVDEHARVDVMICNAAVLHPADILELSEADFDRVVRVNLKGYFLAGQAAAKQMVAQGSGGVIINMSSIQAYITNANLLSYAVCKGGVKQLTVAMALGLAAHGIRVNAIGPGSIGTDMVMQLINSDEARRTVMSRTPMGRLGRPEEIAAVAAFLASDEASYITGENVNADGGRLGLNYVVPVVE